MSLNVERRIFHVGYGLDQGTFPNTGPHDGAGSWYSTQDGTSEVDGEENVVTERASFSAEEARRVGEEIGIDWSSSPFDIEQFRMGMDVELEHGLHDPFTNVTNSDPLVTGKIALAHLKEFPDYYTRLARMEDEAKRDNQF